VGVLSVAVWRGAARRSPVSSWTWRGCSVVLVRGSTSSSLLPVSGVCSCSSRLRRCRRRDVMRCNEMRSLIDAGVLTGRAWPAALPLMTLTLSSLTARRSLHVHCPTSRRTSATWLL